MLFNAKLIVQVKFYVKENLQFESHTLYNETSKFERKGREDEGGGGGGAEKEETFRREGAEILWVLPVLRSYNIVEFHMSLRH